YLYISRRSAGQGRLGGREASTDRLQPSARAWPLGQSVPASTRRWVAEWLGRQLLHRVSQGPGSERGGGGERRCIDGSEAGRCPRCSTRAWS
ncbi:unnamed protein product, partial [Scytosiphon promiscuus]